jgi:hypothetical protein
MSGDDALKPGALLYYDGPLVQGYEVSSPMGWKRARPKIINSACPDHGAEHTNVRMDGSRYCSSLGCAWSWALDEGKHTFTLNPITVEERCARCGASRMEADDNIVPDCGTPEDAERQRVAVLSKMAPRAAANRERFHAATLCDAVIAGLRERGWPEPRFQPALDGEYMVPCRVWGERHPSVYITDEGMVCGYVTGDDQETAHIEFAEEVSAPRIIEAIDRLRWVIGLPPQGLLPLPCKLPDHLKRALEGVTGVSVRHISAEPGSAEMRAPREPSVDELMRGVLPTPDFWRRWEKAFGPSDAVDEKLRALSERIGIARERYKGMTEDATAGLVPLRSKPAPHPERPFVPRKIGEF